MFLWKTFKGALNQHDLTMPASEKVQEKGSVPSEISEEDDPPA